MGLKANPTISFCKSHKAALDALADIPEMEEKIIQVSIDACYEDVHSGDFDQTFDVPFADAKVSVFVGNDYLTPNNDNYPYTVSDDGGKVNVNIPGLPDGCELKVEVSGKESCVVYAPPATDDTSDDPAMVIKTIMESVDDCYEDVHSGDFDQTFDVPFADAKVQVFVENDYLTPGNDNYPYTVSDDGGKVNVNIPGLPDGCNLRIEVNGKKACQVFAPATTPTTDPATGPADGDPVCEVCTAAAVNGYNALQNTATYGIFHLANGDVVINSFTDNVYTGNDIATAVDLQLVICDSTGAAVPGLSYTVPNGVTSTDVFLSQFNGGNNIVIPGAQPGEVYRVKISWTSDSGNRIEFYSDVCVPTQAQSSGAAHFQHSVDVGVAPFDCNQAVATIIEIDSGGLNSDDYQITSTTMNGSPVSSAGSGTYDAIPTDIVVGKNVYELTGTFSPSFDPTKTLETGILLEFNVNCE